MPHGAFDFAPGFLVNWNQRKTKFFVAPAQKASAVFHRAGIGFTKQINMKRGQTFVDTLRTCDITFPPSFVHFGHQLGRNICRYGDAADATLGQKTQLGNVFAR